MIKPTITYEDFSKLDMRIATIVECEAVEKSEKLLKLMLDIGEEEPIQVLSGIAKFYNPEEMIGKQIPVLVNLTPRKMMGLESNGMIIAAGSIDEAILLHPDKKVDNGMSLS